MTMYSRHRQKRGVVNSLKQSFDTNEPEEQLAIRQLVDFTEVETRTKVLPLPADCEKLQCGFPSQIEHTKKPFDKRGIERIRAFRPI